MRFTAIAVCLITLPWSAALAQPPVTAREERLGAALEAEVRRNTQPLGIPEVDAHVQRLGRTMAPDFRWEVVSTPSAVEPFVLPNRLIFVPAGAFLAARDEAEFAGMLAHAAAHGLLGHPMASSTVYRNTAGSGGPTPLGFMGSWLGVHTDTRHRQTVVPIGALGQLRNQEVEADVYGVDVAARAGYDPLGWVRYLQREQSPDGSSGSPLPARDLRLQRMRERVATLSPVPARDHGPEFAAVRGVVAKQMPELAPGPAGPPSLRR